MAVVASLNIVLKADVSNVLRNTSAGRKAFRKYGDDMKRLGRELTADLMTPMERLAAQEKQLQQLMTQGYISHQTYSRGLKQVRSELDSVAKSANRAGNAMAGAKGGGGGGFNILTGKGGGFGAFAKQKLLGGGFVKGGIAGMALSAVAPNVMGAVQERVESGMNSIAGFFTGTKSVDQALEKISFGWFGYAAALQQHNNQVTQMQARQSAANAAMSKIDKASMSFEMARRGVFSTNTASSEVQQGQGLLGLLRREEQEGVARRKSLVSGGSAAFLDPLNGIGANEASKMHSAALADQDNRLRVIRRKIIRVGSEIQAIEDEQARQETSGAAGRLRAETEGRLKSFGKSEGELRLEAMEKQRTAIMERHGLGASSGTIDRFGLSDIDKAIAAEQKLQALEKERQKQDQLKAIEAERQKLLAKQVEERKRIAEEIEREKKALTAGIIEDNKSPFERYMDTIRKINSANLSDEQNTLAKFKATQDLAGQIGIQGNRRSGAIEFGSREAFSAMHSNPLVLTQKQILDIAKQQLDEQQALLRHFQTTGEITVSI